MSRTYRHTPIEFVYGEDVYSAAPAMWCTDVTKHFSNNGYKREEARMRNKRIRRDRAYLKDFDNYTMPNDRLEWWD